MNADPVVPAIVVEAAGGRGVRSTGTPEDDTMNKWHIVFSQLPTVHLCQLESSKDTNNIMHHFRSTSTTNSLVGCKMFRFLKKKRRSIHLSIYFKTTLQHHF